MNIEEVSYLGWKRCLKLGNRHVEVVATLDVGPRVVHFGRPGGENLFHVLPAQAGRTGGKAWRLYGGHRLWYAPEPLLPAPDNDPVEWRAEAGGARILQPPEKGSGVRKEIFLRLSDSRPTVEAVHTLRHLGRKALRVAPWGITVLKAGGTAVLPLPRRRPFPKFVNPDSSLALWPYTDFGDPRWKWETEYLLCRSRAAQTRAQKVGALVPDGWLAYARAGSLFVLQFPRPGAGPYPDHGCNAEIFSQKDVLELESLGPLGELKPGGSLSHTERWHLGKAPGARLSAGDIARRAAGLISGRV